MTMVGLTTEKWINWLGQHVEEEAAAVTSDEEEQAVYWMCNNRLTQIWSREHGVQSSRPGKPCWAEWADEGGMQQGSELQASDGGSHRH